MNPVIALQQQFSAIDPETGKPVTVVGVDLSSTLEPRLIVLKTRDGFTWPEVVDQVKRPAPTAA